VNDFATELGRRVLVCDGAMGTMLHAAGNSLDRALPELTLSNPELVSTIHESYVSAGVDVIQTNTFGANRLRLANLGSSAPIRDINLAGVRLAREAQRRAGRPVFIAGSVSPAVTASQRHQVAPHERVEAIREQVEALVEGGPDVLVFETFGYLEELVEAVTVAAQLTDLPIIAQATFTDDGHTLGGETPREVASALRDLPVVGIGTNCTLGPQGLLAVVTELHKASTLPVSALPNAGLPRRVHGRRFEYSIDGNYFARYARRYVQAGASLIGGCCGTTPTHIRAALQEIADLRPRRPRPRPAAQQPPTEGGGLADRLGQRRFIVAAEVTPPPGGGGEEAADIAAALRDRGVEVFFVPSRESARAQPSSTNLALHLQQRLGVETVATVTTWDKTIMTLQADLLGIHVLGMRTVVCETGNPPLRGDYPNVDGIWEVDSIGLIELLAGLNQGRDCNGLTLAKKTSFHIGARFNPGAEDVQAEIARTRAKIRAGAQFLITRPVHELDTFRRMSQALADENAPLLLAISPLHSFEQAEYLANEVPDVTVPEATLLAMERAGADGARAGVELAVELLRQARQLAHGVVLGVSEQDAGALDELLGAV
jgi:methionine synthase / methylenetetrahydrofolate reductase(NADPH)